MYYERHSIYESGSYITIGTIYYGQKFKAIGNHNITSVQLVVYRTSTTGTFTVELQGVSGGLPDGNVLATATKPLSELSSSAQWTTIEFSSPYTLVEDTDYAIVLKQPEGDVLALNDTSAGYPDGNMLVYNSTWSTVAGNDLLFVLIGDGNDYFNGYKYRRKITIDNTKVSENTGYFLVSTTISDLKTIANGGKCESGLDINFRTTTGSFLFYDLIHYDETTGQLIAYVQATLSTSTDIEVYLYYGCQYVLVRDNGYPDMVWDENYKGVYHLNEAPTGSITDSSGNEKTGTPAGVMLSSDLVTAKVYKGISFDGIDDEISLGNLGILTSGASDAFTISFWIRRDGSGQSSATPAVIDEYVGTYTNVNGTDEFLAIQSAGDNSGADMDAVIDDNTWHYCSCVYIEGSKYYIYVDGVQLVDVTTADTQGAETVGAVIGDGAGAASGRNIGAIMEEVRFSNSARSLNYHITEYNNMNSPSTFYSVGDEETNSQEISINVQSIQNITNLIF